MHLTPAYIVIAATACFSSHPAADPALSVEYLGRAVMLSEGAVLSVAVVARNRGPAMVELEEGSQCREPQPLVLRHEATGRLAHWDERAWRRSRRDTVYCAGHPGLHRLAPGDSAVLARRSYPLRAILGDSLPSGWYEVDVGAAAWVRAPDGPRATGPGQLMAPGARVRLP